MNSISLVLFALIGLSLASIARRNFAGQPRVRIPLSTAEPTEEERQYFAELPHHFRLDDPIITGHLREIARRGRRGPPPLPMERRMNVPKYPREPLEFDSRFQSLSDSLSESATRSSEEAAYQQAKWDCRAKTAARLAAFQARSGTD